ncbi:hypothetical protein OsJ_20380 [Oryza sativa Japonica Group]|uniref:non-specific serine/threonine protein kinase n=1 Tax=Oryza sativa subsp. japonica TaxID=39947 RepID=A3B932_ORYSJ|nr:hypothetical protein OsJ_20380 [Oryza sativa Japonica Group]
MAPVPISVFVFVFIFIFFLLDGSIPTLGSNDHSALMSFKSGVSNDPNGALANWGSLNVCNWTGVSCDASRRRVVKLMLRDQKLSGEVSPALGNLSHLNILNLSGNLFAGRVPPELGNLFRLTLLDISSNTFVGRVPAELGNLSSLNTLDLSRNLFTGEVPPELGDLSKLQQLSLGNNLLEGKIPVELTRMSNLSYLNLGENNLSGRIPPAIFCNFSSLQYIDLSSNSLDGEIPIDCPLPNLMFLVLWANNLVGEIPRSLSNSTNLKWLLLESNYLSGELPADMFGGMRKLELLYLSFNYLRSPENNTNLEPFFASLTNCTSLKELGVAGNELAGVIPPIAGRLGPGLTQLHLEYNSIFGAIPANLSNLTNLTALNLSHNLINGSIPPAAVAGMRRLERLYLSDNMLSGEIPPSLGEVPRLGLVDLSRNRLAGGIPAAALSNLTQLRWLVLHHNHLAGVIPPGIAQCVNLQNLDLSHNMLRGKIPDDLSELSGLLYLNLSSNLLEGMIPATIGRMAMLQVLNLSSNRLSGDIPTQIGGCVALEYVNVSGNALEGGLPDAVAALPFLQVLDVSYNGLSGALPPSLGAAASLRRVNFSYNGFSGEVPGDGAFASFPDDAFLGDDGLCGVRPGMARCGGRRGEKRRVLHDRRVLLPIVVTVVGFTLAILGVVACRAAARAEVVRRDARRSMLLAGGAGDEPGERDHPRISHRELAEATGGFDQASLIGAGRFGRVYEGTLRDGTRVAVKVLDPKSGGEVSRSFKRECEVLRRTRHRNLLVAVAADVAEGLAYLHHYAPVRVVHCDLKPSNVLLDDDMTAVVADFGIAKLVKNADGDVTTNSGSIAAASSDPCNSITGLLQGSVGYIAPEYGLGGHPSTQGDVYSFGVMILELITGKRPTDVIFHEGLTLHDWVRRHYPHDVAAVVARSWLTDAAVGYDVVAELINVGLACTQHSPPARPTMVEVCHEMALLKEDLAKHGHGGSGGDVVADETVMAAAAPPSVAMTASERSCSTSDSSLSY